MEYWKVSGKKENIALMCGEPQTECTLNSAGMREHFLKFFQRYKLLFGIPFSLCKIDFFKPLVLFVLTEY
jgi:hypothetical protein